MKYDPWLVLGAFQRLAPRERLMFGLAVVSTLLIGLYSFVWDPLQTRGEVVTRLIAMKEKDLAAMLKQREAYLDLLRRLEAGSAAIAQGDPNFSLFAHVDTVIGSAVGRDRVTSMNPSTKNLSAEYQEESVEIKLTQINLGQLVSLLYQVEKGDRPLRFSRLQIKKRYNDNFNFDVTATVALLQSAGS